jgi:hypothetical protein
MTKNGRKKMKRKKNYFLDQKPQFTYPLASIKYVQATKEAFSPQKRTSSTSKHEISDFCLPGSIRILIRNTDFFMCTVLYSTLLHMPPFRFHCFRECWDRSQDCCDQCCGSGMFMQIRILSSWKNDLGCTSRIRIFSHPGSRGQKSTGLDPESQIRIRTLVVTLALAVRRSNHSTRSQLTLNRIMVLQISYSVIPLTSFHTLRYYQ